MRIGVSGHRPNRLAAKAFGRVAEQSRQAILTIRDAAPRSLDRPNEAPRLRIVSPLAEGSDRIVAEIGLALGAALECPLPFAVAEYERDFVSAGSRAAFRALLGRAAAVIELAGRRSDEAAAYEAVGQEVLSRSEILIAVWDGGPAAGPGGTERIVQEAIARHLPVIWVHAVEARPPCLLGGPDGESDGKPLTLLPSWLAMALRKPRD
jgi:hypothetical protein